MTTQLPCVRCTHRDHHPVDKMGHRTMPCFHKDLSQPDGFCICTDYEEPKSARQFADAYLGPDPMAQEGHVWEGHDDRD
jgi:hypothetical protein